MKIRHITVCNFRGIDSLEWTIPDSHLIALIGQGDSTKSSVLDAIRFALFPSWNPNFNEFDFFNGDTSKPIEITVTLGDLPAEFLDESKYGLWLRGWDGKVITDEPDNGMEEVISVCLTVNEHLKPEWNVICDRQEEGRSFRDSDRAKAKATYIGTTYGDSHLTWRKNSALSQITDSDNISASLTMAARAAKDALNANRGENLTSFDAAAKKAEDIAKIFGVPVSSDGAFKAQLDTGAVNIQQGGLSLHDDNLPLRCYGLGSRRMLIIGIQQDNLEESHITLVDEVEIGLEPHRIARLLKLLMSDEKGQYFLTTHSPVVLRELTVDELCVVQSLNGKTIITNTAIPSLKSRIQGKIRSGAEAFLARKIIVCEGATEVGLCRGLDDYWVSQSNDPFSYHGVAMFDAGGGSNVRSTAEVIKSLGYEVAVIVDTDDHFTQADEDHLVASSICVVKWDGDISIEKYFFRNLPWANVVSSVQLAIDMHGDKVLDQIRNHYEQLDGQMNNWQDSENLRQAIGVASCGNAEGKNAWFKRQSRAEEWVPVISDSFADPDLDTSKKISQLADWIMSA